MTETLKLDLHFGGGAELLFDKIKKRSIDLPPLQTYLPKSEKDHWTIRELLIWLKENLLREREELFLQGDTVRPGILVLINDTDWELHGELNYELQNNDCIMFALFLRNMWHSVLVVSCIFNPSWGQQLPPEVLKDLTSPVRYLGEGCGYDSCPLLAKDHLNVHIVPHTHGELGLTSFFERHFTGEHPEFDKKVLSNMKTVLDATVTQLWNNPTRRFTLSDLPYFFHWWSIRDGTVRRMVYQLLRQNRLTLVGGGWGMPDEALSHYQAFIDHHTYALRKLNATFLDCGRPLVAWQSDCAGHSREIASLYAQMGYDGLFISPISHDDELKRMGQKAFEFVWRGSDDLGRESDIYTHKLFDGFSCPPGFCFGLSESDPLLVASSNVFRNIDERAEQFIDDVRFRQSTNYRSNNIMVVMGGRFAYYDAEMWFRNIERLILRVNDISTEKKLGVYAFYSTPACYLKAVHDANQTLPVKQDDFFPHQENAVTFATGMYTSMPAIKYMLTEGNVYLQMMKQIQVLAKLKWGSSDDKLENLNWIMGVMQDHTVGTGELTQAAYDYYNHKMYMAVQRSTLVIKDGINKLRGCENTQLYYRCSFNESSCPPSNRYGAHVVVYNPLAWPVTAPVRLPVLRGSQMVVYAANGAEVSSSLMKIPGWVLRIPERSTVAEDELVFLAEDLPALGYRAYYIGRYYLQRLKRSMLKKESRRTAKTPLPFPVNEEDATYDEMAQSEKDDKILEDKRNTETAEIQKLLAKADAKPVLRWDPELVPGFDAGKGDSTKPLDNRRVGSQPELGSGSESEGKTLMAEKMAADADRNNEMLEDGAKRIQQPLSDYSDYSDGKLTKQGEKPEKPRYPSNDYYDDEEIEVADNNSTKTVVAKELIAANITETAGVKAVMAANFTEKEVKGSAGNVAANATETPRNRTLLPYQKASPEVQQAFLDFVLRNTLTEQANGSEATPHVTNSTGLPPDVLQKLKELELIKEKYKTEQINIRKMAYDYVESSDDFIENKYVKILMDRTTGLTKSMTLSNGVTTKLDISFMYYESDDPIALGRKDVIPPGAFVFRPLDPKPQKVGSKVVTNIYKTPIVQEVQMSFDTYASLTLRLYNHRSVVEVDWLVGPLESSFIGKEVFIRYSTDLVNGGVFFTDSNGRQMIKRIRNQRPTYTLRVPDPVAGNFYPVTSKIYIEDPKKKVRLAVFNDRCQGGSSLNDGQVDLMLHRRILTLDSIALAYLNETEFGQPIRVRGKHYIYLTASDKNQYKVFEKKLAKEISLQPQVFAAHSLSDFDVWRGWKNEFTGISTKLPFGIHLLTLQEWNDKTLLIRLENYLEKIDTAEEHWRKKVHFKYLFSTMIITSIKEMTLGANQAYENWTPLEWKRESELVKSFNKQYGKTGRFEFNEDESLKPISKADLLDGVVLEPQQIRTFVVTFIDRD